jgi:hypothetical protein
MSPGQEAVIVFALVVVGTYWTIDNIVWAAGSLLRGYRVRRLRILTARLHKEQARATDE